MNDIAEPTMVGLSETTHGLLRRLKEDGHFAEMQDAYRFGISLALAYGVIPEDVPLPRRTVFSVATIDPARELGTAIKALVDTRDVPTYVWLERLAEWGITELSRQAESGEIDFEKLIKDAQGEK